MYNETYYITTISGWADELKLDAGRFWWRRCLVFKLNDIRIHLTLLILFSPSMQSIAIITVGRRKMIISFDIYVFVLLSHMIYVWEWHIPHNFRVIPNTSLCLQDTQQPYKHFVEYYTVTMGSCDTCSYVFRRSENIMI